MDHVVVIFPWCDVGIVDVLLPCLSNRRLGHIFDRRKFAFVVFYFYVT
jgi:hypothetical protein